MDYRTLSYILVTAEEGNISKAAQKLHISQPSLSHCILKQEHALGVTLFDRTRQPLQLTYAGERYVQTARRILDLRDDLADEMKNIAEQRSARVRLAITKPRSAFLLPHILPRFQKLYPNVEFELTEGNAAELESALVAEKADVAILFLPVGSEHLEYQTLFSEDILLCLREGHPLIEDFTQNGVDLKKLEGEPFLRYKAWQRLRKMADHFFAEHGFRPTTVLESELPETVLGLCAAGMGCGLVPRQVLQYSGVRPKPHGFTLGVPPIALEFVFAWKRGVQLNWAANAFIDLATGLLQKTSEKS